MQKWWKLDVDAIVPCSTSGLISQSKAEELNCQLICGATNLPFASYRVQLFVEQRGIVLPEGVSSAGAAIVDSVEHFDCEAFESSRPMDLYECTLHTVLDRCLMRCWHASEPALLSAWSLATCSTLPS